MRRIAKNGKKNPPDENGFVVFVGAGPGNAELLTLKARKALDTADVILYDALVAKEILELARREAIFVSTGKRNGAHHMRQSEINALLVKYAKSGHRVIRLKGGDPAIFARLAEELDTLVQHNIGFTIIPGITSASLASAIAAAPLSERGFGSQIHLLSARDRNGFSQSVDWGQMARSKAPIAIYMGRDNAANIQRSLILQGRSDQTSVILVESAGRNEEKTHYTILRNLTKKVQECAKNAPIIMLIGAKSRRQSAQGNPGQKQENDQAQMPFRAADAEIHYG